MVQKKSVMVLMLAIGSIALLFGCYKDTTVIFDTGEEVTRVVTFSADVIPIFNVSCNTSGCHSAGGIAPNLTAPAAYNSLINGGYISTGSPDNSELYLWMTGKKGVPMPTTGINKDYNALVLAWIKQGALNN